MACACGRPFVPEMEMYAAHRQTGEHHRWSERNWRAQTPRPVAPSPSCLQRAVVRRVA